MTEIGYKHTKETKKKMRENHCDNTGKNHPLYGKKHSEETIRKMSEVKLGKNNPMFGRLGEDSPFWKGGKKTTNGYVLLLKPNCPCSYTKGYIAEHRYIAYKVLGRCLKRSEVVHHVNEDRKNNSHTNLLICSRSYHKWLHNKIKRNKNTGDKGK